MRFGIVRSMTLWTDGSRRPGRCRTAHHTAGTFGYVLAVWVVPARRSRWNSPSACCAASQPGAVACSGSSETCAASWKSTSSR